VLEFVQHDQRERNHQGLRNALIVGAARTDPAGRIRRRPRLDTLQQRLQRSLLTIDGVVARSIMDATVEAANK